jgi:hypothetical protein
LYRRLSGHPDLRTVTVAEAAADARQELPGIFPGSWIDANFYIWIGHQDDHRAWSQLVDAHAALELATAPGGPTLDSATLAQARDELLVAEGSDWFWWYGDDHSSAHDREFDDLFRRHVRNVYRLLQLPVPDELFVSNISTTAEPPAAMTVPTALIEPRLDGEETSYFEWLGAGVLEVREVGGAMHHTTRPSSLVTRVQYGFDRERLYVRVDAIERVVDLLAGGRELSLKFVQPAGLRFSIRQALGRLTGTFWERRIGRAGEPRTGVVDWVERGPGRAVLAVGSVLEVAVPLSDLGVGAGQPLAFFVAVYGPSGPELERHPEHRPIEVVTPDEMFEGRFWRA